MPAPIVDIRSRVLPQATQSGGFLEGLLPQLNQALAERRATQAAEADRSFRREEMAESAALRRELAALSGEQAVELEGIRQEGREGILERELEFRGGVHSDELGFRRDELDARTATELADLALQDERARTLGAGRGGSGGSGFPLAGGLSSFLDIAGQSGEDLTSSQLRAAIALTQGNPEAADSLLQPGGMAAGGTTRVPPGGDPVDLPPNLAGFSQQDVDALNARPVQSHVRALATIADPSTQEAYLSVLNPTLRAQVEAEMRR